MHWGWENAAGWGLCLSTSPPGWLFHSTLTIDLYRADAYFPGVMESVVSGHVLKGGISMEKLTVLPDEPITDAGAISKKIL